MKVLFVCTGNTCRSVLAELLFKKLAREKKLRWQVRSRGTAADPNFPVPSNVRKLAKELGSKDFHHQPRPISPDSVNWADVILVMTDSHMRDVWNRYPEAHAKTKLLKEAAGLGPEDVEDPIGRGEAEYRACLETLRQAIERLLAEPARLKPEKHIHRTPPPRPLPASRGEGEGESDRG